VAEVDGRALVGAAAQFGRELRAAGVGGDLQAAIDFARALTILDIGDQAQVRAAGVALFVRRHDELPTYHAVFDRFWRRHAGAAREGRPASLQRGRAYESGAATGDEEIDDVSLLARRVGYSPLETLRQRSFDKMTPAELRDAHRLIERLGVRLALRRTRRYELHPHGQQLAARAMLRRNMATGAEPLHWVWQQPRREPRRLVLLCDISGSMERYARLLLRFAHALARGPQGLEAFVFGTQLTRISRLLRLRDVDVALERVAEAVHDWSGGTRIGEAFRSFNLLWARRVLPTSGVVVVLSDGWDRGDAELVHSETARLARNCHQLIWLNPLAAAVGYEPLAGGMAAALPHVDNVLPAASVTNLEQLGALLASAPAWRHAA
jgi:uncharacterized protein